MRDTSYTADKLTDGASKKKHTDAVAESANREIKRMVMAGSQLSDDYEMKRIPRPGELAKGVLPSRADEFADEGAGAVTGAGRGAS